MRIQVKRGETLFFDKHFTERTLYVGRQEACQIHLPADETVSPRHLLLFEEHGQWFLEPLHDQYHRTHVNGHLLIERQAINDGDEAVAGKFKILFFPHDEVKDRAVPVQVIARSKADLQETAGLTYEEMNLPDGVIVKDRTETFSLGRGRLEYLSGLLLRMLDFTDVRALATGVSDVLLHDFRARCAWVGLRTDTEGHLHLSAGRDIGGRPIDAPPLARQSAYAVTECGRAVLYQNAEELDDRSAMMAPLLSPDGSLGMAYVESRGGEQKYNVADLDTLVFLGTNMAGALDKLLREQTEQLEQMRSTNQQLARKVQASMAPWKLPQWPGLQLAVLNEQGTEACTDFYEVVPIADKRAMVMIGQTQTSETDTAMTMTEACTAFRIGAAHHDTPQVLMRQMNWVIFTTRNEPRRMSACALSIDPQSGEFIVSLVGEVRAYVISDTGKVVQVASQNTQYIGEARKSKYMASQGQLESGHTLALSTGGLFKLTSPTKQTFQEQQLLDSLSDSSTQSLSSVLSDLASDVNAFKVGKKLEHDVTLLLLRKRDQTD